MTAHSRDTALSAAMTIGEASRASGVSAKMIRHYEAIGLVPPAPRRDSNYRLYGPEDVHALRFVGRARSLGFPIATIAELLALWRDRSRSNADVCRVAQGHADELRRKLAQLQGMIGALDRLVHACPGDGRPECPILDDLTSTVALSPTPASATHGLMLPLSGDGHGITPEPVQNRVPEIEPGSVERRPISGE